jgi:proteasome accessory factor B
VDPAFAPLTAAARDRRVVTFEYRRPEGDAPDRRRLQPWGVVCWRGRWYVVGHDLGRAATRCFRLSRIVGAVKATGPAGAYEPPPGVDLISHVARWSGPLERTGRATLLVRPNRAAGLRRWAAECVPTPDGDRLVVPYADAEWVADNVVGYGPDVTVLEPPEVREAVIQRLKEIATRHEFPDRAAVVT